MISHNEVEAKKLTLIDTAEEPADPQTDSVIELWSLSVDQRHIFTGDKPAHARSNIGPGSGSSELIGMM